MLEWFPSRSVICQAPNFSKIKIFFKIRGLIDTARQAGSTKLSAGNEKRYQCAGS
jgi:hypothetical protein